MPERYFLDANVLFTAAISPHGVSSTIVKLARIDVCEAVTSTYALDEALRNVRAKYPNSIDAIRNVTTHLEVTSEADPTLVAWAAKHLPTKDAPILAAARAAEAHVLVTGDRRHFGNIDGKVLKGTTVLSPRSALERLLDA